MSAPAVLSDDDITRLSKPQGPKPPAVLSDADIAAATTPRTKTRRGGFAPMTGQIGPNQGGYAPVIPQGPTDPNVESTPRPGAAFGTQDMVPREAHFGTQDMTPRPKPGAINLGLGSFQMPTLDVKKRAHPAVRAVAARVATTDPFHLATTGQPQQTVTEGPTTNQQLADPKWWQAQMQRYGKVVPPTEDEKALHNTMLDLDKRFANSPDYKKNRDKIRADITFYKNTPGNKGISTQGAAQLALLNHGLKIETLPDFTVPRDKNIPGVDPGVQGSPNPNISYNQYQHESPFAGLQAAENRNIDKSAEAAKAIFHYPAKLAGQIISTLGGADAQQSGMGEAAETLASFVNPGDQAMFFAGLASNPGQTVKGMLDQVKNIYQDKHDDGTPITPGERASAVLGTVALVFGAHEGLPRLKDGLTNAIENARSGKPVDQPIVAKAIDNGVSPQAMAKALGPEGDKIVAEATKGQEGRTEYGKNQHLIPDNLRIRQPFKGGKIEYTVQFPDGHFSVDVRMPDGSSVTHEVQPAEPTAPKTKNRAKSKQAAVASTDLLTLGVKPLVEQDVAPAIKSRWEKIKATTAALKKTFNPEGVNTEVDTGGGTTKKLPLAGKMARSIRSMTGNLAADRTVFNQTIKSYKRNFGKLPTDTNLGFMDSIDQGKPMPGLEDEQQFAKGLLDADKKDYLDAVEAWLGPKKRAELESAWSGDYFPRIYKEQGVVQQLINTGRTITGRKTFAKNRSIEMPEVSRAVNEAKGRELATTNPWEMLEMHHAEIQKAAAGYRLLAEGKNTPLTPGSKLTMVKFFKNGAEAARNGYTKINDPISTVWGPKQQGGKLIRGDYYAPTDVARVINNYTGAGFRGNAAFRDLEAASNAAIHTSFAVSGFHATASTINSIMNDWTVGSYMATSRYSDLATRAKGVGKMLTSPTAPARLWTEGFKGIKDVRAGISTDALQALKDGGFKFDLDPRYETSMTKNMVEAFKNGNPLGAAARVLPALSEQLGNLTMKQLVPKLKAGAALDLARAELSRMEKAGIEIGSDEYRKIMASAVDSVENHFGQMARDNQFMDNRIKDGASIITMYGWNLGSYRTLGSALKDTLTTRSRVKAGGDILSERMLRVASVPIVTALVGGMYHYLHTGQAPQDLNDVMHPKSGAKIPAVYSKDGKLLHPEEDERIDLPGYGRDYMNEFSGPSNFVDTAMGKRSPLLYDLQAANDLLQNKDWKADPIWMDKQDTVDKLRAAGAYLLQQLQPISARQAAKSKDANAGTEREIEDFFGVKRTRKKLTQEEELRIRGLHDLKESKAADPAPPKPKRRKASVLD